VEESSSDTADGMVQPAAILALHTSSLESVAATFLPSSRQRLLCKMRWFLSLLLLALSKVSYALSSSGNRLLVVIEDAAEQDKYSTFWGDLEGTN
jgi:hypothetical protein